MNALNVQLRAELCALAEADYRAFAAGLLPGVENVLGVRLPAVQRMAKRLARGDWRAYLADASDASFEEIMLQGLTLAHADAPVREKAPYIEAFVRKMDNWSVCDSFCAALKCAKSEPEETLALIDGYLTSEETFAARFAVVMLLFYGMDAAHLTEALTRLTRVCAQGEAAQTAVAWALSVAYKTDAGKTLAFMDAHDFPPSVCRKAIQKMIELRGVSGEEKAFLREKRRALNARIESIG